jgi:[1-hydroxy-2-(trimethylamino)ethyl]phosphonate dioxygenase
MDELFDIYRHRAVKRYGLADVSQLQHALQAAAVAERQGATPTLVLAALLHDVGHMVHALGEDPAAQGVDDRHEEVGARYLRRWFPAALCEPVRLHVPAKRYLAATEPGYLGLLSRDSVDSLALQGGPMSDAECRAFERELFWRDAVMLRRCDEAAKDPAASPPPLEHFLALAATEAG